jgi:hypothetical protein
MCRPRITVNICRLAIFRNVKQCDLMIGDINPGFLPKVDTPTHIEDSLGKNVFVLFQDLCESFLPETR